MSTRAKLPPDLQACGGMFRAMPAGRLNGRMASVKDIGDELYTLAPTAFTAARDAAAGQARDQGDRATTTAVAGLKRPTQAAWLVNLLALRRPDVVAELIELGEEIRAAQGTVPPAQLRDLSARRRRELDAALAQCSNLATAAQESAPTRQQLGEVETTLAAAMAERRAAAQRHLADAEQALDLAARVERDANAEVERVTAEIARLRELLDSAQLDARAARQARLGAERAHESAQRRMRREG